MGQQYDPYKHRRRSIRLKGWDYSTPAVYFVTICTHQRESIFNDLSFKVIATNAWIHIPNLPCAEHVILDEWIVMPNHLHGIVVLVKRKGAGSSQPSVFGYPRSGSLSTIIGTYKSMVTRRINNLRHTPGGKLWQRGYYERIVRNERELNAIRQYIRANPERWKDDRENLDSIISRMR
ncbi:MAG: transposase [Candidatus Promineifilaceae bacterium]